MDNNFWKELKSGTDIRGVAVDGVPNEPINLSNDVIKQIISSFTLWLTDKLSRPATELTVSIGRDSRISGERILKAASSELIKYGVTVLDCDLASTPSMFMTTVDLNSDAAIMVTASHHPYHRNGLKFFTKNGGLESGDIADILSLASDDKGYTIKSEGKIVKTDYMSQYSKRLRDMICKEINAEDYEHPLSGFKIAVDAGNGAGGFYAYKILEPLGADISGSRYLEPDGMFPNHVPNPENKVAMKAISDAVVENNCDLGVIFDTDVDRGAAVDSSGREINRNSLVALASAIALEGNEGGTIVTDSITSDGLKDYIENTLKGKHHRFKRGYKNVINEALRLNKEGINCPLAIETSGHAAMRENYFLDDGAYLCTKIIIKAALLKREGKTLNDVLSSLKQPLEANEYRLKINTADFKAYGNEVISGLEQYAKDNGWDIVPNNYEGIRISFNKDNGDGWCLLRLSVHDPIMPLNVESNSIHGVSKIVNALLPYLKECKELDISMLEINS